MAPGSLKIGKIYGIDIEVHWTLLLLLLFALIVSTSDLLAFVVVLLLFVCVLIHELAHSITAIRNGVKVKEIVLNIIGGASIIDETALDPALEFRISAVGPLASLLLAGIFGIMVIFSGVGTLTYVLQLLFEINLLLGLFNILPAFPMDGGRVLRSYLRRRMDEYKATITTVNVSNIITALIVIGSFGYLVFGPGSFLYKEFNFFILLIIAVFLYGGAQGEAERARVKRATQSFTIGTLASPGFVLVDRNVSFERLYKIAIEKKEHIMLTRGPQGFYLVDPFRSRSAKASSLDALTVPIPTFKPSTNVFDALSALESAGVSVGVVCRGGKVKGVVTSTRIQAFIYLHMMGRRAPVAKQRI